MTKVGDALSLESGAGLTKTADAAMFSGEIHRVGDPAPASPSAADNAGLDGEGSQGAEFPVVLNPLRNINLADGSVESVGI